MSVSLKPDADLIRNLQNSELPSARLHRWLPNSATGFNVLDVEPRSLATTATVIYPMSYDYRLDALMTRRLQVLSAVIGARVIGVETPGITMNAARPRETAASSIPQSALRDLLRGDFRALATLQLSAVHESIGIALSGLRFVGESLGAQMACSMAGLADTLSLDIVEPVNAQNRGLWEVLRLWRVLTTVEDDRRRRSISRSASEGWGDIRAFEDASPGNAVVDRRLKRFRYQGKWAIATALGLRRRLARSMAAISLDVPISIWRAGDSVVSSAPAVAGFARELAASGRSVEVVTMSDPDGEAGHHVLTGISAMAQFATVLSRRWA